MFAVLAAGCSSGGAHPKPALPVGGPPRVVRIALAHILWPLDPTHARTRDETALARVLFATPLRTDPVSGAILPGLCSSWRVSAGGRVWRLRCSHAVAIAAQLRRTSLLGDAEVTAPDASTLALSLRRPDSHLPYLLTTVPAAPPGVPGPFRLLSASPRRVVAERDGLRLDIRQLDPPAALRLFRAGRLDEAPVPLGDIRAVQRDPQLGGAVRVRPLLGVDALVFQPGGSVAGLPKVRRVYDDTADRADYQALVPEFEAPPAENLVDRTRPSARKAAIRARKGRLAIPSLPKVAVRVARPGDPDLAYGANLLVASWRDLGLGAVVGGGRPDARFERLLAPYPRPSALPGLVRGRAVIPIAWVADARLVSPRLRGWAEDELGDVDYTRVRLRGPSPSR